MQALNGSSARRSFAAVAGLIAATAAAAVGVVLAVVFAATVLVIALMSSLLIGLAGLAFKARRAMRPARASADSDIIEARRVGGHSWVAYGWDRR